MVGLFNDKYKINVFSTLSKDLMQIKDAPVVILEITIDYEKALDARKKFYEKQTPQKIIYQENTDYLRRNCPLFSDDFSLANVLISQTANGKTISTMDSCGCCFSDSPSYDYQMNQYTPNPFVENMFLPYVTQKNSFMPQLGKNPYYLEMSKYAQECEKHVPTCLKPIINSKITKPSISTLDPYTQILANTIWMQDFLKPIQDENKNGMRKEFLSCMQIRQKKTCSYEKIAQQIVSEHHIMFFTEKAEKMWERSFSKSGKILNHFAKYEENSPDNLDDKKLFELTSNLPKNTIITENLKFLGAKIKKREPEQNSEHFRPIC